jgi:hypothetical protein
MQIQSLNKGRYKSYAAEAPAYLHKMGVGAKEHTQTGGAIADVTVTHVFSNKIRSKI